MRTRVGRFTRFGRLLVIYDGFPFISRKGYKRVVEYSCSISKIDNDENDAVVDQVWKLTCSCLNLHSRCMGLKFVDFCTSSDRFPMYRRSHRDLVQE